MLRKLQLNQTQTYELCIACQRSAEMLVAFIQGREHDLRIGSEQGDIATWDDLIIEQSDGTYEHVQIKRQQTDFTTDPCVRDTYIKGNNIGKPRDLSPIDESMKSLALWTVAKDPATSTPPRFFTIEVPGNNSTLKRGFEVRHLSNFCHNVIKPSTTVAGLIALQAADTATQNLFEWLTTWCGFSDWAHILRALSRFRVKITGNETDIEANTDRTLAYCFSTPDQVRQDILTFINNNAGFTSAVTPRPLLGHVQAYALPGISTWTQYVKTGNSWQVTGITDTVFGSVESAAKVVDVLWQGDKAGALKISVPTLSNELLQQAIIRLMIHLPHMVNGHVNNAALWEQKAKQSLGETLGTSGNDCSGLPLIDCGDTFASSDSRPLDTLALSDKEALHLASCMNLKTWGIICTLTEECIANIPGPELRDAIDVIWRVWKPALTADADECTRLCQLMVHPKAEGGEINAALRYGTKTSALIANGFLLLLTVSAALSDTNPSWKALKNNLTMEVKALKFWSGPSGFTRSVRKLTGEGMDHLLGKEQAKVLILSGIEAGASEIRDELLSSERKQGDSLASPKQPMLIVTYSMKFERLIRAGNIANITSFLESEMNSTLISSAQPTQP